MPVALEEKLAHFNRKERFLLVGQALGNPTFTLGDEFRGKLADELGRFVPEDAYCAMDYHLDWLFAAAMWSGGKAYPGKLMEREFVETNSGGAFSLTVTGNQSDVDLIIAWTDQMDRGQIVLLKAKGFTGWSNKQVEYKLARLEAIFGDLGAPRFENLDVHFVIVQPKSPMGLKVQALTWTVGPGNGVSTYFLALDPPATETFAVQRVTSSQTPSANGSHWVIKPAAWNA